MDLGHGELGHFGHRVLGDLAPVEGPRDEAVQVFPPNGDSGWLAGGIRDMPYCAACVRRMALSS
jgi:hypothetical protein